MAKRCIITAVIVVSVLDFAAAAHYENWEPGSCDLSGAEDYLQHFGIGPGLPKLELRFGHFMTREYSVQGAGTIFGSGLKALMDPPRITWEQTGKYTGAKYLFMLLDADHPLQSSEWRPRMHWMKVNAQKSSSSGHEIFPYDAPALQKGRHRFIAILFQQMKPGELAQFMGKRNDWDFEGFMKANREALKAVSYNFFTVDADLKFE